MKTTQSDCSQDCVVGRIEAAIGRPWKALGRSVESGFDCWGFVRYALDIQDAPNAPFFDIEKRPAEIEEFSKQFLRVKDKTPFSIVLMGTRGKFHHVGIYLPTGFVYHCMEKAGVCGHRLRSLGIFGFDSFEFYQWGTNAHSQAQIEPLRQS